MPYRSVFRRDLGSRLAVALWIAPLGLAGCPAPSEGDSFIRLEVVPSSLDIEVGESADVAVEAIGRDDGRTPVSVEEVVWTWEPDDGGLRIVDGNVVAVLPGSWTAVAQWEDLSGSLDVTSSLPVDRPVGLDIAWPGGFELAVGVSQELSVWRTLASGRRENVTDAATFVSSNPDILAVEDGATIRAAGVGFAALEALVDGQIARDVVEVRRAGIAVSPRPGELGVAVTRETIIQLDAPLADGVTPTADNVYAIGPAGKVDARIQVDSTRRRITLFYADDLPASAEVEVFIDGDSLPTQSSGFLDVDGDGVAGGRWQWRFSTVSTTLVPGTQVCGRVFASELQAGGMSGSETVNAPLAGVTVTVDGLDAADASARTDAAGDFCLDPSPAGRFFVHIDGTTADAGDDGAYYPNVGKAWEAEAGVSNNIGDVFLPLVAANTLRPVSTAAATTVGFPANVAMDVPAGDQVRVTVPAGSLFSDNGSVGGAVGIAPVPPDRLPGTLPAWFDPGVVITIQTDGPSNFDVPAPVCFPNLPNAETGEVLLPGEQSALWSFNHDTARFEISGPATVSDDGAVVCSDAGFGVLAPGWHFVPPTPGSELEIEIPERCANLAGEVEKNLNDVSKNSWEFFKELGGMWVEETGGILLDVKNEIEEFDEVDFADDLVEDLAKREGASKEVLRDLDNFGDLAEAGKAGYDSWQECSKIKKEFDGGLAGGLGQIEECRGELVDFLDEVGGKRTKKLRKRLKKLAKFLDPATKLAQAFEWGQSIGGTINAMINFHTADECPGVTDVLFGNFLRAGDFTEAELEAAELALETFARAYVDLEPDLVAYDGALDGLIPLLEKMDSDAVAFGLTEEEGDALIAALDVIGNSMVAVTEAPDLDVLGAEALRRMDSVHDVLDEITGSGSGCAQAHVKLVSETAGTVRTRANANGLLRTRTAESENVQVSTYCHGDGTVHSYPVASGSAGSRVDATEVARLVVSDLADTDGDGLSDAAEDVVGTRTDDPDTDGDGVPDGAELDNGTDPLDGLPVQVGLFGAVDTVGTPLDLCIFDDLALVAEDVPGVEVFSVFDRQEPARIGEVPLQDLPTSVACGAGRVAVGTSTGVVVLDTEGVPAVLSQTRIGAAADAVAWFDGLVVAGLDSSELLVSHGDTGVVLWRGDVGVGRINDFTVAQGEVWALTSTGLHLLDVGASNVSVLSSVSVGGREMAIDAGAAWVATGGGLRTVGLTDPLLPVALGASTGNLAGLGSVSVNGSGLALTNAQNDVFAFDASDPADAGTVAFTVDLPSPVNDILVYNGLLYGLMGSQLAIVNYLAYDAGNTPPSVSLDVPFASMEAYEQRLVTVSVSDDVQVGRVELWVNGASYAVDGAAPFEFWVEAPSDAVASQLSIQARARDTGGNLGVSAEVTVDVLPDTTAPALLATSPRAEGFASRDDLLLLFLSERVEPASASGGVQLEAPGVDETFGTADDVSVPGSVSVLGRPGELRFTPSGSLAPGVHRATLSSQITDLAGNSVAESSWSFTVYEVASDTDGDCVPDDVELALGYDPFLVDSDNDGLEDGEEDGDGDGVANCAEILAGLDATSTDSDRDGLLDGEELGAGTNPLDADSDGDGFTDGDETIDGTDPLDAESSPLLVLGDVGGAATTSAVVLNVVVPPVPEVGNQGAATALAVLQNLAAPPVPAEGNQGAASALAVVQNLSDPPLASTGNQGAASALAVVQNTVAPPLPSAGNQGAASALAIVRNDVSPVLVGFSFTDFGYPLDAPDGDDDGVPDDLELALGLDPGQGFSQPGVSDATAAAYRLAVGFAGGAAIIDNLTP